MTITQIMAGLLHASERSKEAVVRPTRPRHRWLPDASSRPRVLRSILLPAVSITVLGCVTPITVGENHFGLGIYHNHNEIISDDVTYQHVSGLGLLAINGRLSFGFADHQSVAAQLDDRSYHVVTPMAKISVGAEAERRSIEPSTFISLTN